MLQDYTIRFLLVQQWLDPRLAYTVDNGTRPLELHRLDNIERIWLPDTYMVNAKLGTALEKDETTKSLIVWQTISAGLQKK